MRADIVAVVDRDPAANRYLEPVLYLRASTPFKLIVLRIGFGVGAAGTLLIISKVAHRRYFRPISIRRLGSVAGSFSITRLGLSLAKPQMIEDNVSMLHDVTLGGTGKQDGDRHPKIRCGVMIGAGAKILGNIEVGPCARIAAGSVVLHPVPPKKTVAGVPAERGAVWRGRLLRACAFYGSDLY